MRRLRILFCALVALATAPASADGYHRVMEVTDATRSPLDLEIRPTGQKVHLVAGQTMLLKSCCSPAVTTYTFVEVAAGSPGEQYGKVTSRMCKVHGLIYGWSNAKLVERASGIAVEDRSSVC